MFGILKDTGHQTLARTKERVTDNWGENNSLMEFLSSETRVGSPHIEMLFATTKFDKGEKR